MSYFHLFPNDDKVQLLVSKNKSMNLLWPGQIIIFFLLNERITIPFPKWKRVGEWKEKIPLLNGFCSFNKKLFYVITLFNLYKNLSKNIKYKNSKRVRNSQVNLTDFNDYIANIKKLFSWCRHKCHGNMCFKMYWWRKNQVLRA